MLAAKHLVFEVQNGKDGGGWVVNVPVWTPRDYSTTDCKTSKTEDFKPVNNEANVFKLSSSSWTEDKHRGPVSLVAPKGPADIYIYIYLAQVSSVTWHRSLLPLASD